MGWREGLSGWSELEWLEWEGGLVGRWVGGDVACWVDGGEMG